MRLYMFEHCSRCFRVRMAAVLSRQHLQETVVLDDDTKTLVGLVGKRVIPILVKDDGSPMLESMDMVRYIEGLGQPDMVGPERPEIAAWAEFSLPGFAAIAAHDHYLLRKRKALGNFVEFRANTRRHIVDREPANTPASRGKIQPHSSYPPASDLGDDPQARRGLPTSFEKNANQVKHSYVA